MSKERSNATRTSVGAFSWRVEKSVASGNKAHKEWVVVGSAISRLAMPARNIKVSVEDKFIISCAARVRILDSFDRSKLDCTDQRICQLAPATRQAKQAEEEGDRSGWKVGGGTPCSL